MEIVIEAVLSDLPVLEKIRVHNLQTVSPQRLLSQRMIPSSRAFLAESLRYSRA
jgi:hypothetical protein